MSDKTIKIALLLTAVDKMSEKVTRAVEKSQKKIAAINNFSNKALIAGGVGTAIFGGAIKAAEDSDIAQSKLQRAFQGSTKDYLEATEAAEKYAGKLQYQIGVEDEVIMGIQTKIAGVKSFTNQAARQAKFLEKATLAAFDLQAAGIGNAEDNILKIGKAMNDPIKAMALLSRWQIKFEPQEKARIIAMVRANKTIEAQKLIMDKISNRAPGQAERNASAISKIQVAWNEVEETLGKAVLPAFLRFTRWIQDTVPKIQNFLEKHQGLIRAFAAGSIGLLGLGAAGKIFSFAFGPVGKLVTGASKTFSFFFTKIDGATKFMKIMGPVLKGLGKTFNFVGKAILGMGRLLIANPILIAIAAIAIGAYLIIKNWKSISAWFSRLWNSIKTIFNNTWLWIKKMFLNYTPYGLIFKHWNKIQSFFTGLWSGVKNIFNSTINWFASLGSRFFNAGKNIIVSIWNGIKSLAMKPVEAIEKIVNKIRRFLPFSPAKEGPLKDLNKIKLIETIAATINPKPMIKAMQYAMLPVMKYGDIKPSGFGGFGGGSIVINSTVHVGGGANKAEFQKALDINNKDLIKRVEDAISRKQATSFTGKWNY